MSRLLPVALFFDRHPLYIIIANVVGEIRQRVRMAKAVRCCGDVILYRKGAAKARSPWIAGASLKRRK